MNQDVTIWQAVTSRISSALPACEVQRTYDPEQKLKDLESSEKTQVLVCLASKTSIMTSKIQTREDYEFQVFVVDYISSKGEQAEEAELDALLTIPPTIYDAFAYKTTDAVEGNESINLKLLAGNDYQVEYLTTYETFVACITLHVTAIREITETTLPASSTENR